MACGSTRKGAGGATARDARLEGRYGRADWACTHGRRGATEGKWFCNAIGWRHLNKGELTLDMCEVANNSLMI